jgi:hypothetical protein
MSNAVRRALHRARPPHRAGWARWRSATAGASAAALVVVLGACTSQPAPGPTTVMNGQLPSGSVEMHQVQAAFIGSGGGGTGVLHYNGRSYPFKVGGVGIGGIGASTIDAEGDVYNLQDVAQFPGAYAQGRYGFVVGNQSAGDLWLKNESGVVLNMRAKRTGLMLSLGGDAVVISMNNPSVAQGN